MFLFHVENCFYLLMLKLAFELTYSFSQGFYTSKANVGFFGAVLVCSLLSLCYRISVLWILFSTYVLLPA